MSTTSRKEREKERNREQILTAADEVFRRKGYQGTTMEQVADEAEFSKGTLYLYFGSKFALFAELSNRVLSKVLAEFKNISQQPLQGREMIVAMLRQWVAEASANIGRFRLAISWIASEERPESNCPSVCAHRETVALIIAELAGAIVRGQRDGSIGYQGKSIPLGCQLWSGMIGALLFSSRIDELTEYFPLPLASDGFMDGFVDLLSAGLASQVEAK